MANYKVSYKVLRQQGEALKATAKLIDGYSERVSQINGKLGNDAMLAQVRQNLQKLREQLGESRSVLHTAGELLDKSVEGYLAVEIRQVKKVDAMKAHNRDFYKNPVVVASSSGAANVGVGAGGTIHYTDNSINIDYGGNAPSTGMPGVQTARGVQPMAAGAASAAGQNAGAGVAAGVGIAAGAGVLGGAAAVGAVLGGAHIKKKRDEKKAEAAYRADMASKGDDALEAELEEAMRRVRDLEEDDT